MADDEITQADRDAAKPIAMRAMIGELSHEDLHEAFARHRIAGEQAGAEKERAAIVAWLRGPEPYPDGHDIADAIEAGEHLK